MPNQSLFAHLATKFGEHPENLATESLNYILGSSDVAKKALTQLFEQTGIRFKGELSFQTQVSGQDNAIPDIEGTNLAGEKQIIIEGKFWAGLTENQPVIYLNRLPKQSKSILVFVSPAKRFETLWLELIRRIQESGQKIGQQNRISNEFIAANVTETKVVAIVSWRTVLSAILTMVESANQTTVISDTRQLIGLCDRMDDEAFLPLRSEELAPQIGKRIVQFCQIIDEVTERAVNETIASVKNLKASSGLGWYGRYMRIYDQGCCLHFNAHQWSKSRETPIYLEVLDEKWGFNQKLKDALSCLERETPPRMFLNGKSIEIPIFLPIGVEKDKVVDAIYSQFKEIAGLLKEYREQT